MYVVMEYLPMGSLKDYLKTHREHINNAMLLKFAVDIAEVRLRLTEWREGGQSEIECRRDDRGAGRDCRAKKGGSRNKL